MGIMKIDPKGLSRQPSSCVAGESCLASYTSAKETLRVWKLGRNRELIRIFEAKVKKVIPTRGQCERVWEG